MKIESFEDIEAWKEARNLVKMVYKNFKDIKDFGIKDQIQRAAVSIMSNIAEGFDRGSNKEFIQFLTISRGSVSEVKSLLYCAFDIGYINKEIFDELVEKCTKISSLINGFVRYLRNTDRKR
jgi:four helix bundle protein